MSAGTHRPLRRRLEFTLVGVALVSVLLLSLVTYLFARVLIVDSVTSQLSALRDTRVQAIELSADRVQDTVATIAVAPGVVAALEDLSEGYRDLDSGLTADQREELVGAYDRALEPLRAEGLGIPTASVLPRSAAGQYVQYHYIVENPGDAGERDQLDDAGDGSSYTAAHASAHPVLRSMMQNAGFADLLLIDADSREVVYSTEKRVDIGTHVVDGPWADSRLGEVMDQLADVTVGDAVISDSAFYVPARGEAVIFIASAVRSGTDVLGAVVAEVPVAALTDLVTADQEWELIGLGDTGDIYVIGSDGTLRTDPRAWLDDPELFIDRYLDRGGDEAVAEQMRRRGSPALFVQVDNQAVSTALDGEQFVGLVSNYQGSKTYAASGPVDVGNLNWVVVIEQQRSEATAGLASLLRGTLIVIAILLPTTALLAWALARSLTRPFEALVDASARIARGEPVSDIDLGNNELGDVGRQLENVARTLQAEEQAILDEERHITDALGAAVPPRLIDRVRQGEHAITDLADTATIISMVVDGLPEANDSGQDELVEIDALIADELADLMKRHGIEFVRRSSSGGLLVAGLGHPDARCDDAVEFADLMLATVSSIGSEFGRSLTARVGLACGAVATGVVGQSQLAFSVWGDAVSSAVLLSSIAEPGQVLVDDDVAAGLDSRWLLEPTGGVAGLDDTVVASTVVRRESEPTSS